MAGAVAEAPVLVKAPSVVTRHLFHTRCNPEGSERVAYCGLRCGTGMGAPWHPDQVMPDICVVCLDARSTSGCPRCGWKADL